jgi:CDGSH-type Zn-finger protein
MDSYSQVRVRVIEGRNIAGSNVSPVVKVSVSNQARQTRVKKSTNKPFFDEVSHEQIPKNLSESLVRHQSLGEQ